MNTPRKMLLCTRDRDTRDLLRSRFEKHVPAMLVDAELALDRLRLRLQAGEMNAYGLIVCSLTPFDMVDSSMHEASGIDFVREVRALGAGMPVVLFGPTEPTIEEEMAIRELEGCEFVLQRSGFDRVLCVAVSDAFKAASDDTPKLIIEIDPTFERGAWQIRGSQDGKPLGPVELVVDAAFGEDGLSDAETIEALAAQPSALNDRQIIENLKRCGRRLYERMFTEKANYKVATPLRDAAKVTGFENTTISFTVDARWFSFMFEALWDPVDEKFWSLQTCMFRRINAGTSVTDPGRRAPLVSRRDFEQGKVNVLVIQGVHAQLPSDGRIAIKQGGFERDLRVARYECEQLYDALLGYDSVGRVERLVPESGESESDFLRRRRELLAADRWDIVHFAGHGKSRPSASRDDPREEVACLLLPVSDSEAELVQIQQFATWLQDARFVYLSCCSGGRAKFALELVESRVPAVVGYRWDIEDHKSTAQQALMFYQRFLEEGDTLPQALRCARASIEEDFKEKPVWAAPVLTLQASESVL